MSKNGVIVSQWDLDTLPFSYGGLILADLGICILTNEVVIIWRFHFTVINLWHISLRVPGCYHLLMIFIFITTITIVVFKGVRRKFRSFFHKVFPVCLLLEDWSCTDFLSLSVIFLWSWWRWSCSCVRWGCFRSWCWRWFSFLFGPRVCLWSWCSWCFSFLRQHRGYFRCRCWRCFFFLLWHWACSGSRCRWSFSFLRFLCWFLCFLLFAAFSSFSLKQRKYTYHILTMILSNNSTQRHPPLALGQDANS